MIARVLILWFLLFPGVPAESRLIMGAKCDWKAAKWISLPGDGRPEYTYFLARREFDLEPGTRSALLYISADLLYRLYVNGQFAGDGPPRNTTVRMSYRTYEVMSLLKAGRNAIAVEVYNQKEGNPHLREVQGSRPGAELICQLELRDEDGKLIQRLGTDENWRVVPGEAWEPRAWTAAGFSQSEIYDARKEPIGWRRPGFNDSGWHAPLLNASEARFQQLDAAYRPHTFLEPSTVPAVIRTRVLPKAVVRVGEVVELDASPQWDVGLKMGLEPIEPIRAAKVSDVARLLAESPLPATIMNEFAHHDRRSFYDFPYAEAGTPSVRQATLILDFGELLNGHFFLDVEGRAGNVVDIAWGQTLIAGSVRPKVYVGPINLSHADRYTLRNGRQQWESFHYQSFRYVQLTFRYLDAPLKLYRFAAIKTDPDFPRRGSFRCSDPILTWAWQATEKTLRLATQDTFMDNTIREKGVWGGECGGNAILSALVLYGDDPISRHYIRLFTVDRHTNRYLLHIGDRWLERPVETPRFFFHPLRLAYALLHYFYYTDDQPTFRSEVFPAVQMLIRYYSGLRNSSGLIENPPGSQWMDWAPVDAADGKGAPQNLLFCLVLREAASVAMLLGAPEDAAEYARAADEIATQVRDQFWSAEDGVYVDSIAGGKQRRRTFSEHSNYLALLAGLGGAERQTRILNSLSRRVDSRRVECDTAFMIFPLKALFELGHGRKAVELMRERYGRFYRAGSETLWEEFSYLASLRIGAWTARFRSLAQSASAVPAYILSSYILGVKPTKPGFIEFTVNPQWGGLKWAEGAVPSPFGEVSIAWSREGPDCRLKVTVPPGTTARVVLPKVRRIIHNGAPVETSRLRAGEPDYPARVVLPVPPGSHTFHAQGVQF